MTREEFSRITVICEYYYRIHNGREELTKQEKPIIKTKNHTGFRTTGCPYTLSTDVIGRWGLRRVSPALYEFSIILTRNDDINDYLPEVRAKIAALIKKDMDSLQESLNLVI